MAEICYVDDTEESSFEASAAVAAVGIMQSGSCRRDQDKYNGFLHMNGPRVSASYFMGKGYPAPAC